MRPLPSCLTLTYTREVGVVDSSHRTDYMRPGGVSGEQASEALADPDAVVFDPDFASQCGRSVRTIGWSPSAGSAADGDHRRRGWGGLRRERVASE